MYSHTTGVNNMVQPDVKYGSLPRRVPLGWLMLCESQNHQSLPLSMLRDNQNHLYLELLLNVQNHGL